MADTESGIDAGNSTERPIEESIRPDAGVSQKLQELFMKERGTSTSPTLPETTPATEKKVTESIHIPLVTVEKTNDKDTLVDIHVNNPMKRVLLLLEEIKKQKAFSFTLRGSLGVMGVVLALSTFGIFGGNQLLCDKGLQTRTGTLKVLQLTEENTDPSIPWTKVMLQKLFFITPTTLRHRVVLLSPQEPPIHLLTLLTHKPEKLDGSAVIVTGNYNTCASTITLRDEASMETL